jgi:pimeloyl-ACP methyl ester carboxylesterase
LSKNITKLLADLFILFYTPLAVISFALSSWLFFIAESNSSRFLTVALILIIPIPIILYFKFFLKIYRFLLLTIIINPFISIILFCVAYSSTPIGKSESNSPFQSVYLNKHTYQRNALTNIIPEIDQFKLGSYLIPLIDPVIDKNQSKRIRKLFLEVYRDMRKSSDFKDTGSVMNYAYKDVFSNKQPGQHLYIYTPKKNTDASIPLILFLHGSGGNFKGYMWNWRSFAEENNVIVVAPSFGFGMWDKPGSPELINNTLSYLENNRKHNISKRYLVGLSNGGIGAYRIGTKFKDRFDGLVMISPVMESSHATDLEFTQAWHSKPMLVLHGEMDRRIPFKYVKNKCEKLKENGVNLRTIYFPSEDHFLMFSSWVKVKSHLKDWMVSHP